MLVLASNSPRRKELLALGGWNFSVMPAEIDERPLPGERPDAYVLRLARKKATTVAGRAPRDSLVLAADTTVVDRVDGQGQILGKPDNAEQAEHMLLRLRGRSHLVHTALAVLRVTDGDLRSDVCTTRVRLRNYADDEIRQYIGTGDPLDKAGAYAIQHPVFDPVEGLQGCYTNVVGLPLCRLVKIMVSFGAGPPPDAPYACLYTPQESCSFYTGVLGKSAQASI